LIIVLVIFGSSCSEKRNESDIKPFGFGSDSSRFVSVYSESGVPLDSARVRIASEKSIFRSQKIYWPFEIYFRNKNVYSSLKKEGLHLAGNGPRIFFGMYLKTKYRGFEVEQFAEDTLIDFSQTAKEYKLKNTYGMSWTSKLLIEDNDTVVSFVDSMNELGKINLHIKNGAIDKITVADYIPGAKYF
jgi:hypothetical protein